MILSSHSAYIFSAIFIITHIKWHFRIPYIGEKWGFPRMFGSLDCMHWKWKICPTAWTGEFRDRSGSQTIILEVVVDYDLWIGHADFGMSGTNNDINMLESSHIFSNLVQCIAPYVQYVRKIIHIGYYFADGYIQNGSQYRKLFTSK